MKHPGLLLRGQGAPLLPPITSSRSMLRFTLLGQHPQPSLASTSEPTSCRENCWPSTGDGYSRSRTNTWMATKSTPYCNLQIPQTLPEGAGVSRWPCLGQLESGRCGSPVGMRKHTSVGAEHAPLGQAWNGYYRATSCGITSH